MELAEATMSYVANLAKAGAMRGASVGNGQCVAFVHAAIPTPPSALLRRGALVKGNAALPPGTVIATFDQDGRYGNHTDGRSHAAIYLGQNATGIRVLDQWKAHTAQPVHERVIRFRNGHGSRVNDGDQFDVVE